MIKKRSVKLNWTHVLSVFFFLILLGAYSSIFAIGQKYSPGEILDPECDPGEENCTVDLSLGGPITVVNGSSLFSTGLEGTGNDVTNVDDSNFFGQYAGYQSDNASSSNFFGPYAGFQASSASYSNFLGDGAGTLAVDANNSNFFGYQAGYYSSNAYNSNFLGSNSGYQALNASNSNFFGPYSGYNAENASNSIFIGTNAGYEDQVDNTTNDNNWSILLGYNTNTGGYPNSILLGGSIDENIIFNTKSNQFMLAPSISELSLRGIEYTMPEGQGDPGSVLVNDGNGVLSWGAGGTGSSQWITNGDDIYYNLGKVGINTTSPIGQLDIKIDKTFNYNTAFYDAGSGLNDATFSGDYTGSSKTNTVLVYIDNINGSDSFTYQDSSGDCPTTSGVEITGSPQYLCLGISVTFGQTTGHAMNDSWVYSITSSLNSNPLVISDESNNKYFDFEALNSVFAVGFQAGASTTTQSSTSNSNFLGYAAGASTTSPSNISYSNFFGYRAGGNSTLTSPNISYSNFLGYEAGAEATMASNSNFLGYIAGSYANRASNSNFLGSSAGFHAVHSNDSNFLGNQAGYKAISADHSNFFGYQSGSGATFAFSSNFLGSQTGYNASNASYSNFIGDAAGVGAQNASNSIFIGTNAGSNDNVNNLGNTDDFSILIGKDTSTDGNSNSIAIGGSAVNTASNQFMIGSVTRPINQTIWNTAGGTTCTLISTGLTCTSDEDFKTNIEDLDNDTLNKLLSVRTVTYNWKEGDTDTTNIGFLAQDLGDYFPELVSEDVYGNKSVNYANMTPILTEAIREMDLKLEDINNLEIDNSFRDNLIAWFANVENKITRIFTGEICLTDPGEEPECINRSELKALKALITTPDTEEGVVGPTDYCQNVDGSQEEGTICQDALCLEPNIWDIENQTCDEPVVETTPPDSGPEVEPEPELTSAPLLPDQTEKQTSPEEESTAPSTDTTIQ